MLCENLEYLFFFSLNLNEYEQFKKEMKNKNKIEQKKQNWSKDTTKYNSW